jgi:uncharacterized coiled-coil protein SlyX
LKKLIQLLAVSAGSGLLLGAGMRLADNRSTERSRGADGAGETDGRVSRFAARLEALEKKIAQRAPGETAEAAPDLRSEIAAQLEAQIEAMEARLRQDLGRRHDSRLGELSDALEKRVSARIAPIEAELAGQREAVGELREYSVRTEKSLQKLLEGIDRLVESQNALRPVARSRE